MVSGRAGRSRLGCLVVLLLLVAAGYFGVNVGEAYLRYVAFRDAVRQEVRFARMRTDAQIRERLVAKADSLGLPDEARRIGVVRSDRDIVVTSEYGELVELPGLVREIPFSIREEGPL